MSLSERIAALTARNSPSKSSSSSATHLSLAPGNSAGSSVRDKAARFDGIGAAPVPKGSFGLGAPPSLKEKKSHELYGNRIASVAKVTNSSSGAIGSGSRSNSTSRGSSPSANGLGAGRPLTEEAVEALGSAVPDLPAAVVDSHMHAGNAFHSVPPSEVGGDASSSVAADLDESEDTSVRGGEPGRRSPALSSTGTNTNSTVSDTALREAPPVLSPSSSTANVAGLFGTAHSSVSNIAIRGLSTSTVPTRTTTGLGVTLEATPPTSMSSEHSEDVGGTNTTDEDHMVVEEPSVAPLPLSARLLESLDVSGVGGGPTSESGLATPKSVMVESGSVAGGQMVDDDTRFDGLGDSHMDTQDDGDDHGVDEAVMPMTDSMDVDVTDLASDDGNGETDTRVQPELRISGPVLPLSQSHLRSLQASGSYIGLSASPSMRSGMETPKSTYVEDGGSVDGREREELVQRALESGFEEYDEAAAVEATLPVEELYTPLIQTLEIDDSQRRAGSPMPQSPAILAYAQDVLPTEATPAGPNLAVPTPVDGTATSEARTPIAGSIALPDTQATERSMVVDDFTTPTKMDDVKMQQRATGTAPVPELTLNNEHDYQKIECKSNLTLDVPEQGMVGLRKRAPRGSNDTTPESSSRRESMISLPDTPDIIQAFPSVPTTPGVTTPMGTIPEIVSTSYEDRRSTVAGSMSGITQQRLLKTHGKSASGSFLEPTGVGASGGLRRSASSSNVGTQQTLQKKSSKRLVPGVWIDDDTPLDEEDEPGWARIVVSRQSYQA